ncbi:PREDICTED: probable disease resistance RPP1 [Prunus dulcis]|uniref:PREDICTED: probable disease resistance RPP1 n=1 Tax=Prunus dulcis TaxID=3755 RepID=A0A5E4GKV3_PRUDU|nr:hypothetical protein L3X38_002137 [Prunus dulcis]VVA40507.1 PREDICTED: probable disease resistance RPP1 [Prunus dulcis]
MSTGHLFLKPSIGDQKKQGSSEDSKASIDQENSNSSRMSATLQPENETSKRKTNKGRRGSHGFSIVGNKIKGNKSSKVGIFAFGNNTHIHKGHHQEKGKQVHSSSGETDSASSSEGDEAV